MRVQSGSAGSSNERMDHKMYAISFNHDRQTIHGYWLLYWG